MDDAGHIAYVVGGSVRDFLLGRQPKDHDIATSARPDELSRLFPDAIQVGKAFGVLKIPLARLGFEAETEFLEIATFREDLEYRDHRRPTGVLFSGPVEDACRRDFTVNALFFDPKTSRILDCVGGMDDLKAGVLRAIGDPQERFREDALRMLRAARFTAALGFKLDPATAEAVRARAKLVHKISGERIRDELTSMLTGPRPAEAVLLLADLQLLARVLPEVESLRGLVHPSPFHDGDVWQHTLQVLRFVARQNPSPPSALPWAALLHAIGKPAVARARTGEKNFNGHEIEGALLVRRIGERLRMPGAETDAIADVVENHLKFRGVFRMRESTLQRFLAEPRIELLLAFHRAYASASDGNLAYHEFCASRLAELRRSPRSEGELKLLSGEDLIQLGLSPGPRFSEILRSIEDLALERKLTSKEEALEYVVRHFVR